MKGHGTFPIVGADPPIRPLELHAAAAEFPNVEADPRVRPLQRHAAGGHPGPPLHHLGLAPTIQDHSNRVS
jgi:hypothetical protein